MTKAQVLGKKNSSQKQKGQPLGRALRTEPWLYFYSSTTPTVHGNPSSLAYHNLLGNS